MTDRGVVAVTGAGGTLGPLVVRRLREGGAALAVAGRDPGKLGGLSADVTAVDLLDGPATTAWAERLAARPGGVDALVHLVGGWRGGTPIEEAPLEEWAFLHDQLVLTTQNVTRAFARHLLAAGHRGRFVIVSSTQAQAPTHRNASYAAAKAAAEAWTLALADRFRGTGATANIVVVGAIVTPAMRAAEPERDFGSFTPAEEITEAIAYVLSDGAAALNGQRLILQGS